MSKPFWRQATEAYKGLPMRCAPGTHAAAVELLMRHCTPCAGVLDVASGSGAMLQRLLDAGFSGPTALELDVDKFQLAGITPARIDLNGYFAAQVAQRFRVITAIEIIEHLDSPRHFLSQLRELLQDDGVLILTTPNVSHWLGRLKFLLRGELRYFDESQYRYNHHVSPIVDIQMRQMCQEIGFRIVESTTAGTFFGWGKMAILSPVEYVCRAFMGSSSTGDVCLYLLARGPATTARPTDWTVLNVARSDSRE